VPADADLPAFDGTVPGPDAIAPPSGHDGGPGGKGGDKSEGCACDVGGGSTALPWLLLLAAPAVRRRRR
jgi:MYXO-CTERM domain-containing protein